MQKNSNDFMIDLLVQPRFRVFRHILLFALILSVSLGFIYMDNAEITVTPLQKYGNLIFYIVLFLGVSYLNMYLLIPHFLWRNKWLIYFCLLMGLVIIIVGSTIINRLVVYGLYNEMGTGENANYLTIILNLFSSSFSIFFFFAGITTLTLFKNWLQDMQRTEALASATLQSELKLLKNQINPHFLFNMLNNAKIMMDEDAKTASHILARLEDLLHYQINDSMKDKVYLQNDINFLTDFLELEKTRRDHFEYTVSTNGNIEGVQVSPLLFIPFVENAVKHNSDNEASSYVHLHFDVNDNKLTFICENSVPLKPIIRKEGGIGLVNTKRRLDLLYPENYLLEQNKTETTYTVHLELNI